MVMKKLQKRFVDISSQNMEANIESRLLQLELDAEHAKREINELRDILISLSWTINEIDKKIEKFIDGKE